MGNGESPPDRGPMGFSGSDHNLGFAWTNLVLNQTTALDFVGRIAPALEAKAGLQRPTRRLFGESMGGLNALILYAVQPSAFASVAAICPALLGFDPFGPDSGLKAYLERHRGYVVDRLVVKWREKIRSTFGSSREWEKVNPLARIPSITTPLLLSTNGLDAFGFNEATGALAAQFPQAQYFMLERTAHCQLDGASIRAIANQLSK